MAALKFGISFHDTSNYDLSGVIRYGQMVEELGFDSLWITENIHSGAEALEPLITLGVLASHTERIAIGPSVVLLPLRNPVGLAHAVATLDRISGGRLILGIGAGGDAVEGFEAYGVPTSERGRRCDEALQIITQLSTGGPVSHAGRFYRFAKYTLGAPPVQRPHPPIWVGGTARGALRRLARWCDGFLPQSITPQEYTHLWSQIQTDAEEFGRDASKITKAAQFYYSLAASKEEARRIAEETLSNRYKSRVSFPTDDDNRFAFGTALDCARCIESFVKIGVTHFVFSTTRPPSEVPEQIHRFAEEVLLHFK